MDSTVLWLTPSDFLPSSTFSSSLSGHSPDLHSFPTRRSSDLDTIAIAIHADVADAGSGIRAGMVSCADAGPSVRSEEHTSELQSRPHLVCRLLLEKKKGTLALDLELLLKVVQDLLELILAPFP